MNPQLALASVVVAANRFNPSVISQVWLVKHGIVGEADFAGPCVLTPDFVQLGTTTFNLFCAPTQLQFAPVGDPANWTASLDRSLAKMLKLLPHTPFTAIGLNFVWYLPLAHETAGQITRSLFALSGPITEFFDAPNSRFGAYLSTDYEEMRLKLDIKPVIVDDGEGEALQFSFNFHRTLGEQPLEEMLQVVSQWDAACKRSAGMVETICGGWIK